jgi:SET domain-containing protein
MNRAQLVRRVLRDCYCRLQPSRISGIGVFAVRTIPRGTNPFKTMPKYQRLGHVRITGDELAALPAGLSRLIQQLFVPADGKLFVPTCGFNVIYLSTYLNHSPDPNMRTRDGMVFTTRRVIQAGEELTVDYRTYGAETVLPPAPRRRPRLSQPGGALRQI